MGRLGRILGRVLAVLIVAGAALWWFGPYEPAPLNASFDPRKFGEGVQVYFESIESRFDDITAGTEKRVIWAEGPERKTPYALVYLHGWSATSQEIRPVPDRIAEEFGANIVYTRFAGHGRPGPELAKATVAEWMHDTAEALAAGRAVGEKVIVLSTSTGGTLATVALLDPEMSKDVVAAIFVSPNYGIHNPLAPLITWPAARYWLPPLVGYERSSKPIRPDQGVYWTMSYPSVAVMPVAALVKAVDRLDVSRIKVPALFWFSPQDQVVRPDITESKAAKWGGPATVHKVTLQPGDDPDGHVIAGDIMSPGETEPTTEGMIEWLKGVLK